MYKHQLPKINIVSESTCRLLASDAIVYMTNHLVGDHVTRDGQGYETPSSAYITGYNYNVAFAKVSKHLNMDLHYLRLNKDTQAFIAEAILLEFLVHEVGASAKNKESGEVEYKLISNIHVMQSIAKSVFSKLEGVGDVNFELCCGIKPIALFYSFYKEQGFIAKLNMMITKGADITEREFIKVDKVVGKFSKYDLDDSYKLEIKSLTPKYCSYKAEAITHYYKVENYKVEEVGSAVGLTWNEISKYADTSKGFAMSDYIYAGGGLVACIAKTAQVFACHLVPVIDLGLDYLGITSKYLLSSFFIVDALLSALVEKAYKSHGTEQVIKMGESISQSQHNVPVANYRVADMEGQYQIAQYLEKGVSVAGAYFIKDAYDGVVELMFGVPEFDSSTLELQ